MTDLEVTSKNGILIRLPEERWEHIVSGHSELDGKQQDVLAAIEGPDRILAGSEGELLAVRKAEPGKWQVVVYRELDEDGFIVTAFLTSREQFLNKRQQVWP